MSKTKTAAADGVKPEGDREVALLADCAAGSAGAVVAVSADEADSLVAGGHADDSPAAVEHRKTVNAKAD